MVSFPTGGASQSDVIPIGVYELESPALREIAYPEHARRVSNPVDKETDR